MSRFLRFLHVLSVVVGLSYEASSQIVIYDPVTNLPTSEYTLNTICQGGSLEHCINVSSNGTSHFISNYTLGLGGTFVISPPANPSPRCFRYTAPFNFTGNNTLLITVSNNLGESAQVAITIKVVNPNTPIDAGPNQSLCSPVNSTVLTAINPDPLVEGYWTVFTGPGTISGGTDSPHLPGVDQRGGPTVTVSDLHLGTNIFKWTQVYPCTQSIDLVTIYVYNGTPPIADANTCYPSASDHATNQVTLCGTTTYTLCANSPGTAATGTWNIFGGSGTIYNVNNASAQITNLGAGCNSLEWTISNGTCPGGDTKDSLYICVYPTIQEAITGPDIHKCLGSPGSVIISANTPTGANTGLWTFVSGPTTPTIVNALATSTNITGLTLPGVYQFNWTITSGPCGSSTEPIYVYIYSPSSPVNAGPDQSICLPNNSIQLNAESPIVPAAGTWTVITGTGSFVDMHDPTSVVNGLSVGANTFRWTVSNGNCNNNNTYDEVVVYVYPTSQPTPNAGTDQTLSYSGTPLSTTLAANAATAPGEGTWTFTGPSTPVFSPSIHAANATISNLIPGTYTFTWTLTNGNCSNPAMDEVQILVYDCAVLTTQAGPNQSYCAPDNSALMNAMPAPAPAIGTWTVVQGGGSIAAIHNPATAITNIPVGVNVYRWTIQNGNCGTFYSEVTVNIHDNSFTTANAGMDQEFCAQGNPIEVTMDATASVLPATGIWSGPGTITDLSDPNTTVNGLPVGLHNFTWTVNNGPCGTSSDVVAIKIFTPNQTQANAGSDQSLCSTANNTSLIGNSLVVPATGVWSVVSGGGTIVSPTSQATAVTNIPIGHNVFRWTIYNGPCANPIVSQDEVSIDVFDSNQLPANAGADQNVCSNVSSIQLSGNSVIAPGVGTWTVVPSGPTFSNANASNAVVTNLTPGTSYTFTWTIQNGQCGTSSDAMVVNYYNSNHQAANAGSDHSICLPTNSVQLNGNIPDTPATGVWSLISGPNIPSFTPNVYNTTLSGLVAGTYVMRWTINNGPCSNGVSTDDVIVQVFSNNQSIANAGSDQSICLPVTYTSLTANALIAPATGTWSQISGPNTATINNPNLSVVNVTNLVVGCYVFRWTVNNGSCTNSITTDDVMVCVYSNSQTIADAGVDQNICSPATSTTLSGNTIIAPATGTWTVLSGPNTPTFSPNEYTSNATLGNLVIGTYVLQWTVFNGGCANSTTQDNVVIKVFDSSQQVADAGILQEICSPNHTVNMSANDVIAPAVGTWTLVSGAGSITAVNNPTTSITNIPIGVNCFRWTIDNGGCGMGSSMDEVCVNVFSVNQTVANAGIDQDICSPTSSVTMSANAVIAPAVGSWVQLNGPNSAHIVNPSSPTTVIDNLEVGCYEFQWSIDNGVCANPTSSDIVEICVFPGGFPAAFAGNDQEVCTPIAAVDMSADAAIPPGEGTWTLISGPNTPLFDLHDPMTNVSGLVPGVYLFNWALNYASCGAESDDVVITVFDSNQGQALAGADQSMCTPQSSTTLAAQPVISPGYGTWSLLSGDVDFVNINDPNTVAYNIPAGNHTLLWTIYNGGCLDNALSVDTIVISIHDNAQMPASVGSDISICSTQPNISVQGTSLLTPATGVWTTSGSAIILSPNSATSVIENLSVGIHTFCWSIDNGVCNPPASSDCLDVYVYDTMQESANAGLDQNICASSNTCTNLSANAVIAPAIGTWIQIDGLTTVTFSDIHSPTSGVCGMNPGVYVFQWCIDNGACGTPTCDQVTVTVFPDDTPAASVGSDVELCSQLTSVNMNASNVAYPAYGEWNLLAGVGIISDPDDPQTVIHGLEIGENVFEWCVYNGVCPNSGTCDTLSVFVYDESALQAFAGQDQDLCGTGNAIQLEGSAVTIPAQGTWSALGAYDWAIDDIHNPATTLTGLSVGEYYFMWTVYNGPCDVSNTSDIVRIRIFDSGQADANAGNDIQICTPQSMVFLNANDVLFPATAEWQPVSGGSGTLMDISNPATQLINLLPGISEFVWIVDNGPCGIPSTDTVAVYVFDANIPPASAGVDQYFCAPIDLAPISTTLNGSVVQGAGVGTWTQISGPSTVVFTDEHHNNTQVDNLVVGQYVLRWSVLNGPCGTTEDDVIIQINDPNLPAADGGEDMDYCTPVNTHTFSATPVAFPAQGTWSAFPPVPITPDIHSPNAVASNLGVGYQLFIWTVNNGACAESMDVIQIRVYDEFQPSSNAGSDIELCLPATSVNLASTDIFDPAVGIWDQVSGCSSVMINDVNSPGTLVSQLCVGTQCFRWTVDNGPCPNGTTMDTVCVRVYDPNIVVEVSSDQSLCTPESSVVISGTTPSDPNTGTWSIVQGGGTIEHPTQDTTVASDLPIGINIFRWQLYNGNCDNELYDEVTIKVYDATHPAANAGDDVEMCFPQDTTTLVANTPITPAIGYWTLVEGAGTISDASNPQIHVTDLQVGHNVFVWTIENGPCANSLMTDTVVVHVFPENAQYAMGGPDQEICTPNSSVTLAAINPLSPSVGIWEEISLNGTVANVHDPNTTVDFLTVGIHTLQWTIDNGPCNANHSDTVIIYVYDQTAQDAIAGEDIELCAPLSSTTLNANEAISPGIGFWTVITSSGNPIIDDVNDESSTLSGLSIGVTELTWTIDNGPCGISIDTLRITVFDPTSPNASVGDQQLLCDVPQCVDLQGSLPIAPAYGWWTQIAGDSIATIADTSSAITSACGLALNETAFVWNVYNGTCANGNTTDTLWFYIYDPQVAAADAGLDTAYCDPDMINHQLHGSEVTGTIEGLAVGTWSGVGGTIVQPEHPITWVNDISAGVHCFTWTVDNGACGITSDTVCVSVYNQNQTAADAGDDLEICANEFLPFYLNGNEPLIPATGEWTVLDGPASLQGQQSYDAYVTSLGDLITALVDVPSVLQWTIDNGACGTTMDTVLLVLKDCETLKIPDAFSPNGDGTNDVFYIPNLEYYPNNRLQIYNRWGSMVYSAAPYKNDWDGRSTHTATIGEVLPVATYYYVLSLGESYGEVPDKVFTGFIFLKR